MFSVMFADIVEKIVADEKPPYRPNLPQIWAEPVNSKYAGVMPLMKMCWAEDPDTRPNANEIRRLLRQQNNGRYRIRIHCRCV